MLLHHFDKFDKDVLAVGVDHVADLLTIQLGQIGVHDDAGGHVVDPEVVFELRSVTQMSQMGNGLVLGRCAAQFPGGLPLVVVVKGGPDRKGQFFDALTLARHHVIF